MRAVSPLGSRACDRRTGSCDTSSRPHTWLLISDTSSRPHQWLAVKRPPEPKERGEEEEERRRGGEEERRKKINSSSTGEFFHRVITFLISVINIPEYNGRISADAMGAGDRVRRGTREKLSGWPRMGMKPAPHAQGCEFEFEFEFKFGVGLCLST